jgi:hypothetical protein
MLNKTETNALRAALAGSNIDAAGAMIAEFSPATASAFRNKPFHRAALAEAFEAGFSKHSDYTRKVCAFVLLAAKADRLDRLIAAARQ